MTRIEEATRYAEDVLEERIPAGRLTRLACDRFIRDRSREGSWQWILSEERAARVVRFIQLLPHVKGEWARRRELIRLEPWQIFIVTNLFGWVDKERHLRRFLKAYIEVPRKNAKSTLMSGIGLYMLGADGEMGAEVYSAATSAKQAREVFDPAFQMVARTPGLRKKLGLETWKSGPSITQHHTGSKFEPLPAIPRDGSSPSCGIIDEYHEHKTTALLDAIERGQIARAQPLLLVTTTAGLSIDSPCYRHRQDLVKVLEGQAEDERHFIYIAAADPEVDWTSDLAIEQANPNLGVSVNFDILRADRQKALRDPQAEFVFKTKHLNLWVQSRAHYFDYSMWAELADPSLTLEEVASRPGARAWFGMDLAAVQDLTALVVVVEVDGIKYVFPRFYIPERKAEEEVTLPWVQWRDRNYVTITPGVITDYEFVKQDVIQLADIIWPEQFGYDSWSAQRLADELRDEVGLTMVKVRQSVSDLSPAMKRVKADIEARAIRHPDNPVMNMCIANVTAREDANRNVFPRRESEAAKIDGAVAMLNAYSRLLLTPDAAPVPTAVTVAR